MSPQYADKDGRIKRKRENAEFRGTTQYASVFTHEDEDQCPRDDLISLFYVFTDLLCGRLPWTDQARSQSRDRATIGKEKLAWKDPAKFVDWMRATLIESNKTVSSYHGY